MCQKANTCPFHFSRLSKNKLETNGLKSDTGFGRYTVGACYHGSVVFHGAVDFVSRNSKL